MDVRELLKMAAGGPSLQGLFKSLGLEPKQMKDRAQIADAVIAFAKVAETPEVTVYSVGGSVQGKKFTAVIAVDGPVKLSP